jgi:hypothetical protein
MSDTDLYAMVTSIVVNDLGKDPQLAIAYYNKTKEDISDLNHDIILLKAVKTGLVQCLDCPPLEPKAPTITDKS